MLLPGRDGAVGAVVVQEGGREVVLNTAYATARTGTGGRLVPGQATPDEVQAVFADAQVRHRGLRLDLPHIDWDQVTDLLFAAYRLQAPRRLAEQVE